jgi:hypothetical protein
LRPDISDDLRDTRELSGNLLPCYPEVLCYLGARETRSFPDAHQSLLRCEASQQRGSHPGSIVLWTTAASPDVDHELIRSKRDADVAQGCGALDDPRNPRRARRVSDMRPVVSMIGRVASTRARRGYPDGALPAVL